MKNTIELVIFLNELIIKHRADQRLNKKKTLNDFPLGKIKINRKQSK